MNDILKNILRDKKMEIGASQAKVPISRLFELAEKQESPVSLTDALDRETVAVVAELKKQSPTAGVIKENADIGGIAESYAENGAAAISVLTDFPYFGGTVQDLALVRKRVNLPLLRKDFILEPYQIVEARAFGADAVLLIAAALEQPQIVELIAAAAEVYMQPLVEVHTEREADRVLCENVQLLGINNRNLNTFEVDLQTTERVMKIIPEEVKVISESGIKSPEDVENIGQWGVDAVLIGETFMRQPEPGIALKPFVGVAKCSR